jgi:hypothetical protein
MTKRKTHNAVGLVSAACLFAVAVGLTSTSADQQGTTQLATSGQERDSVTSVTLSGQPCGNDTLTQSAEPKTLISPSTVQCAVTGGGPTTENGLARSFEITQDIEVCGVQFGVETNDSVGAWPIEVRLLEGDISGPYGSLQLRGTSTVMIPADTTLEFFVATFNPPVAFSAGEDMVVELYLADRAPAEGGDGGRLFLGSNDGGQSAPSYIRAAPCGISNFVTYASIGFPDVHLAMKVFTGDDTIATVALESDTCETTGTLSVEVNLNGNGVDEVVGGQFFLVYDMTRLSFISASPASPPSPFTLEIHEFHVPGMLQYAVGVNHGQSGTTGDATMAVLTFDVLQEDCDVPALVIFGPGNNLLSDNFGEPVIAKYEDLDVVILDQTPPDLTAPADDAYSCTLPDGYGPCAGNCGGFVQGSNCWCDEDCHFFGDCCPNVCVACPLLSDCPQPSVLDNCDANPTLSFSDMVIPGPCPQAFTIERTWVATDECGHSSLGDVQIIEIFDNTSPTVSGVPANIVVYSDAGICGAVVTWTPPTATDNCTDAGDIIVSSTHSPGDTFPIGITPVSYSFTDECGNTSKVNFTVEVLPVSLMDVDVALQGVVAGPFTRCIEFELTDANGNVISTVSETLTFSGGQAAMTIEVPCGIAGACVMARDPLHTLRETGTLSIVGTSYLADGFAPLRGGDLNDDGVVDILDFGVYVFAVMNNPAPGADTDCNTVGPHADIVGDGVVFTADFTQIQINFLALDALCPVTLWAGRGGQTVTITPDQPQPRRSISVEELRQKGLSHLAVADLNGDGVIDEHDIALFLAGHRP